MTYNYIIQGNKLGQMRYFTSYNYTISSFSFYLPPQVAEENLQPPSSHTNPGEQDRGPAGLPWTHVIHSVQLAQLL